MMCACMGGYMVLGLFQLTAIYSFFRDSLGWWPVFAWPASLVSAYIPLFGTGMGIYAAHDVWGWTWMGAALLFVGPLILIILVATVMTVFERLKEKTKASKVTEIKRAA